MTNEAAEEPKGSIEKELAGIWKQLLKLSKVGRDEDFFELGGHSLLALQLIGQIKKRYGYAMLLNELFSAKTISLQAALVEKKTPIANKVIVKLDHLPKRNSTCLLIHPITGDLACYRHFTKALEPFCSFYGIQADQDFYQHKLETSIPKIAENYIQTMKKEKFPLPDFIGGWSFGGCIAYEIATQLQKENHRFKQLILIDSSLVHGKQKSIEGLAVIANLCNELLFKLGYKLYQEKWFQWINENPWTSLNEEQLHYYKNLFDLDHPILASTWKRDVKKILKSLEEKMNVSLDVNADYFTKISWNIFIHENALRRYKPANSFEGNVLLFKSAKEKRKNHRHRDWEKVIHGKLDSQIVDGDHISMLEPPYISQITQFFRARSIFE